MKADMSQNDQDSSVTASSVAACTLGDNPFSGAPQARELRAMNMVKPELVSYALAVLPGQPCMTFYNHEADVAVSVSPNGLFALDPEMPTGIHYPITVVGPLAGFTKGQIASFVVSAFAGFEMNSLAQGSTNADSDEARIELPMQVRMAEINNLASDTFIMQSYVSFVLSPDAYNQCCELLEHQLGAISVLAAHNTPPAGQAAH